MSPDTHSQRIIPPSRRRDKPIISCQLCRKRNRGLSLSCTYVRNAVGNQEPKIPNSVHERIDQLEKLVTTLMSGREVDQPSPSVSIMSHMDQFHGDTEKEIPGTPDRVKLSDDTTSYTNSGHWTSILDGISELREHLDQIPTSAQSSGSQGDNHGPDLLFGRQRHASKQELLAALPPRSEADQLVETCLASMDTGPTLLHKSTFLREYNDFWIRPFETSTMWLGLLYSVLAVGALFQATFEVHGANLCDPSISLSSIRVEFYREKIVQCVVLANYTKCPPYTVETFMMYFGTEYLRSADFQMSMWLMVGMIVRMAFRMGYHRDPSRFPNISPFRGEMRRRAWIMVMSLDLISSSSVGLPRMIQPAMYDTQEPRNLAEDDLQEDMLELPPARPETELTQLLYSIVLSRVRIVHARVMDLMNATSQPPYREIMELDATLREVYTRIPDSSKITQIEDNDPTESPGSMRRYYLGLSFLISELMLHRPYLIPGRTDPKYEYSRRVCLNAALEMLNSQRKLDSEIRPGGKLWFPGWQLFTVSYYLSSVVSQNFLLATTILILDLDEDLVTPLQGTTEVVNHTGLRLDRPAPTRQEIISVLQDVHEIWSKASKRSNEARRVAAAIRLVLRKANLGSGQLVNDLHTADDASEQSEFTSQAPSFDFNNMAANFSGTNGFSVENNDFTNPFMLDDTPMDLNNFVDTFSWVCCTSTGKDSANVIPLPGRFTSEL
ncbi:hypothetical protein IQ07DRAFT_602601 [Pyrenochaeta sp. DS3sAY3a]|nr:hypothetical protein IQ07DRAFT_602601 [Pyrenochaeta sp. DS3sAY3a]